MHPDNQEKDDDSLTVIQDEDELLRGIPPDNWNFYEKRPSTNGLSTKNCSVDWGKLRTYDDFMARRERKKLGHGLVVFYAGFVRSKGMQVKFTPNPEWEPDNDAHAEIPGRTKQSFVNAVTIEKQKDIRTVYEALRLLLEDAVRLSASRTREPN